MTAEQEKALHDLITSQGDRVRSNQRIIDKKIDEARDEQIEPTLVNTQNLLKAVHDLSEQVKTLRIGLSDAREKIDKLLKGKG